MRGVAIIVAGLLLSGCLQSESSSRFRSAKDLMGPAEADALVWAADANLLGVRSVEPSEVTPVSGNTSGSKEGGVQFAEAWNQYNDTNPGDGLSQAWSYVYVSAAKKNATHEVIVKADKTVLFSGNATEAADFGKGGIDSAKWKVDSNQAGTKAAGNASWQKMAAKPGIVGFMILVQPNATSDPVWIAGLAAKDGSDEVVLAVNARDGASAEVPNLGVNIATVAQEGAVFTGMLNAQASTMDHTFKVQNEGHPYLAVRLTAQFGIPGTTYNFTVKAPGGAIQGRDYAVPVGAPGGGMGGGGATVKIGTPVVGDYTIHVTLKMGASGNYRIAWCGKPVPTPPPMGGGGMGGQNQNPCAGV